MREAWRSARVGLMVLLGIAAGIVVYRYVHEDAAGADSEMYYVLFDDAQGLIRKSQVVIAGIPVGTIEDISLEGGRARVDIAIDDDIQLYEDARVALKAVSLLGEKLVEINPGTVSEAPLPPGSEILVSAEAVGASDVMATVNEVAENVREVTAQLARSFGTDEAGDRMESALLNLSEALEGVNRTIQQNEAVVQRTLANIETTTAAGGPELVEALRNLNATSADVRELIANGRPSLERGVEEVDDAVVSIRRASEQLEDVLADTRVVTDRVASGEGTIGRLTSDEVLIDEVEGVAEGLNNLVGGLGRLQTIVGIRSEYNFLANTFKTYFSLRLQAREGRYFLVQLIDDPRGTVRTTQSTVSRTPPAEDEPARFTETRTTRSEALVFTFQFAKRISFATFRFGILENTGGLGLDLHLIRNRLELHTDVFAIGVQAFPRVRFRAAFEIVSKLWINAGIDDAFNESADFFMGLSLRFNDDDLRS
ncbi:MAG: MlaD family protein, partial [Myxococcota bacterium]